MFSGVNCREFKHCGREAGGAKAAHPGVCPAHPDYGNVRARIAGTLCGGVVQGTFAAKVANCIRCGFFASANDDIHRKVWGGEPQSLGRA